VTDAVWTRSPPGKPGRWSRSILWFSSTPWVKIRHEGLVRNKAVHIALGVRRVATRYDKLAANFLTAVALAALLTFRI